MRLRIQDNTLGIRLGNEDIGRLRSHGEVRESVHIGTLGGPRFMYVLTAGEGEPAAHLHMLMESVALVIRVPHKYTARWTDGAAPEMDAVVPNGALGGLRIIIQADDPLPTQVDDSGRLYRIAS